MPRLVTGEVVKNVPLLADVTSPSALTETVEKMYVRGDTPLLDSAMTGLVAVPVLVSGAVAVTDATAVPLEAEVISPLLLTTTVLWV